MATDRSLIQHLPVELLSEIFEESQWQISVDIKSRYAHSISQALKLSSVCKRWRAVALNTPRLWTNIVLDLAHSKVVLDARWEKLRSRAGAAAVNLTFKSMLPFSSLSPLQGRNYAHRFDPMVFPNISSITYMANIGKPLSSSLMLLDMIDFRRGQVDTLHLIGNKKSGNSTLSHQWDWAAFLARFSGLRAVEIVDEPRFSLQEGVETHLLPSIRSLRLMSIYETTIVNLLHLCPNLEDLKIVGCAIDHAFGALVVRSMNVESFELKARLSGVALSALEFPSLRSFKYHCPLSYIPQVHLEFVERHTSITDLELVEVGKLTLLAVAHVSSQIRNLKLTYHSFFDIPILPLDDEGRLVFPELRNLDVVREEGAVSIAVFERFVEERCLPHSHLRSLSSGRLRPLEYVTLHADGPWVGSTLIREATKCSRFHVEYGKKMTLGWL